MGEKFMNFYMTSPDRGEPDSVMIEANPLAS